MTDVRSDGSPGTATGGASPVGPLRAWTIIIALSVGSFLFVTIETLPIGLLSDLASDLSVSDSAVGQLVTVYALCVMLAALPLTVAFSRFPRRALLVGVFGVFVAATATSALARDYAVLLAVRAVIAMAQALFWSVAVSLAGTLAPRGRTGRAIALVYAGISFAQLLGVPGGVALGHWLGWRWAMGTLALAGLPVLLVLAAAMPSVHGHAPIRAREVAALLGRRRVRVTMAAITVAFTGTYVAFTYISPLLQRVGHVSAGMISVYMLLFGAAGVAGNALAGGLVDSRPRTTVVAAIGGIFAVVVTFASLGGWTPVTVLAVVAWGLCGSALPTVFTAWALRVAPDDQETAMSLLVIAVNFGLGAGALLGGRLLDGVGPHAVAWGAAVLLGMALPTAVSALRTTTVTAKEVARANPSGHDSHRA
ncbi:MFS transporter [Actinomadura roseirufa]|uniref:MFS transporter n=1 Tax=Actinomadura roseirufa TaxID=2094049 RepID=UPI001041AA97|nr:MFS transporter [Actinomadura roseirufa]